MSAVIVPYDPSMNEEVRAIFFQASTRKNFATEDEREEFYQKYVGFYLKHFPEFAWVARSHKLIGYVVVSPETKREDLYLLQPHLKAFEPSYKDFPAHLHINCHDESRGQGIGGMLMAQVEAQLRAHQVRGLHIMTASHARNQNFYIKLGFTYSMKETFSGSPILLMGKSLLD